MTGEVEIGVEKVLSSYEDGEHETEVPVLSAADCGDENEGLLNDFGNLQMKSLIKEPS